RAGEPHGDALDRVEGRRRAQLGAGGTEPDHHDPRARVGAVERWNRRGFGPVAHERGCAPAGGITAADVASQVPNRGSTSTSVVRSTYSAQPFGALNSSSIEARVSSS